MTIKTVVPDTRKQVEARLKSYLESQGYQVLASARRIGKSGIEHAFDLLAQNDDGFTMHLMAFVILTEGDK